MVPANNLSTIVRKPYFTWRAPSGAVKYEIRYTTNFDPATYNPADGLTSSGTVVVTDLKTARFLPSSPLLISSYYWQVRAFDAAGNPSPWSDVRKFKINSLVNDAPQPHRFGPSDDVVLTWAPISWTTNPAGGYYEVQVDNNSNFLSPEYQRTNASSNRVEVAEYLTYRGVLVSMTLPNGTWYWRVRACPASGTCGSWSTTGTFTVEK